MKTPAHLLVLFLVISSSHPLFGAENWPQFRGPGSSGVAEDDPRLPEVWSATRNVVWKREVPGLGWSCPIVWGDKVFLTSVIKEGETEEIKKGLYYGGERPRSAEAHLWMVYCLDTQTGEFLWDRVAHQGIPHGSRHNKNTYASETPVTDGERVYAYFGNAGLFAYDFEGNEVWTRTWEPVETQAGWGPAASPILHDDRVIVVNDNKTRSFLSILDKKTGEILCEVEREEEGNWATPFVWENPQRTEIVTPGSKAVRSYDLEGNLLWSFSGMSKITVGTPFAGHGFLYLSSGFILDENRPVYAVKPGASGDITLAKKETQNEYVAWKQNQAAAYIPSSLLYGDYYYVLLDQGFLTCYDAKTGEEVYDKQRLGRSKSFTASPWAYNGNIFCLSEDGDTTVIEAGPEYKVTGVNDLEEFSMATPAIANGSLYIRTASHLYRIQAP